MKFMLFPPLVELSKDIFTSYVKVSLSRVSVANQKNPFLDFGLQLFIGSNVPGKFWGDCKFQNRAQRTFDPGNNSHPVFSLNLDFKWILRSA